MNRIALIVALAALGLAIAHEVRYRTWRRKQDPDAITTVMINALKSTGVLRP